jgi:hypothetical protein
MKLGWFVVSVVMATLGCGSSSQICNCPNFGGASVSLPADIQAKISSVTGDTCSLATIDPTRGVVLTATRAGDCHVRIALSDGEILAVTETFKSPGGCCASEYYAVDGSAPITIEAGSETR